jgi:homeobox-leucine zipper protein
MTIASFVHARLQLEKLAEMMQEPRGKYGGNAGAVAGEDVRSGVGGMKEEFADAGAGLYSSEGADDGGGKFAHFTDDEAGALFRPSPPQHQPAAGFTSSGPPEHQPFQFHSSCWPSSTEQTCSSSQWWEFESLSE